MIRRLSLLFALLPAAALAQPAPEPEEASPAEESAPAREQDTAQESAPESAPDGQPAPGNVRNQAEEDMAGEDDFIPSAQISEDLSVSFPVDI